MDVKELYDLVLSYVCRHTGVKNEALFSSNREEYVDARAILVNVLIGKGVSEREIASLTGLTQQCVNKLKNNFRTRLIRFSVKMNLQLINNELTTGQPG